MTIKKNKNRKYYIDLMRIISAFLVIFNHSPGYLLFLKYEHKSIWYWFLMFISILDNLAVPLFFIISGALLLGKRDKIRDNFKQRIIRYFVILLLFASISYFVDVILGIRSLKFVDYFKAIYSFDSNGAYWFLYSYLAFIICLPLLQRFTNSLKKEDFYYLFFIYTLIEPIYRIITYFVFKNEIFMIESFNITWICTNYIIYTMWGYYLENIVSEEEIKVKYKIYAFFAIIASLFTMFWVFYSQYIRGDALGHNLFHHLKIYNSLATFITVKYIFNKIDFSQKFQSLLKNISDKTFGIYLIHAILIRIPAIRNIYYYLTDTLNIKDLFSALIYTSIVFILSFIITTLLKHTPRIKKLI